MFQPTQAPTQAGDVQPNQFESEEASHEIRSADLPEIVPKPATEVTLPQPAASRGIGAAFGLDPRIAILAIVTDMILFAGDVCTLGGFVPVAFCFACGLGVITYLAQKAWHGDDRNSALIKAMIVTFLTALPGPITPFFAIPAGLIGLVNKIRHR
jgi:hypothetical protein